MQDKPFHQCVAEFLEDQGHATRVEVEDPPCSGLVRFKTRGNWFFVHVDDCDPLYYIAGTMANMGPGYDPATLVRLCTEVERDIKGVKLSVQDDGVRVAVAVEQFLAEAKDVSGTFWRSVSAVQAGAQALLDKPGPEPVSAVIAAEHILSDLGLGDGR